MTLDHPLELAAELGPAARWLLVLDFDGVLSPIVEHPEDAAATPGVVDAVGILAQQTTVAIVSGRPIAELDARLGVLPVVYAGGHGAEVRTADGHRTAFVDPDRVAGPLDTAEESLEALLPGSEGWQIERKAASLAVHHRRVDDATADALLPRVHAILEAQRQAGAGFEVLAGKSVVELRPSGVDKGRALAWIAERSGDRPPLVLGDDVTDEDAFHEAERRGGMGILVADAPRATVARRRLRDPDEVATFLRALGTGTASGAPD
ncbi:trehalose-phosphatase [Egicoccus sp. AB-alg6-2]|uniref:trehalose-phosphatase n=1 Tax=Egicoccus sp. AB-alg6-2 TaxID=3242692 RepID=UPI00359E7DF2